MLKCEINQKKTLVEANGKGLEVAEDISRLILELLEGGVPIQILTKAVMIGIDAHLEDKKEVK
ncbi:MAG: hypothetical protein PHI27_13610 [Eubacteriales bacterium]|nr:hypothetical protein [Eubacteriales bacterium]